MATSVSDAPAVAQARWLQWWRLDLTQRWWSRHIGCNSGGPASARCGWGGLSCAGDGGRTDDDKASVVPLPSVLGHHRSMARWTRSALEGESGAPGPDGGVQCCSVG
ncbi:hypothetical protein E2562_013677 [Oryza meyeriana var. granulata]|uniref:Uncharacterized protein n=1 Tax=Oryza meyeriana var. granulata TaxID=110450 RepID=A0A6G1BK40_9ORYZ|nr:hypothetical protein E2562_013677 [Oryza meyeriana var. granulata]